MDLSKLSDDDLKAIAKGDMTAVSDEGLRMLAPPKSQGFARDYSMGAYRSLKNLYGLPVEGLNAIQKMVTPKPFEYGPAENQQQFGQTPSPFWGTSQDIESGLQRQGIDPESAPRNFAGMLGEYTVPTGLFGKVGTEVVSGILPAVGGYVARQVAPDSTLAEMLGAITPAALKHGGSGLLRRAVRSDPAAMRENLSRASDIGAPMTVGTASKSQPLLALEKMVSSIPGGVTPFRKSGEQASVAMRTKLAEIAGGEADDILKAGRVVDEGLFGDVTGWAARTGAKRNALYNKVDQLIPSNTLVNVDNAYNYSLIGNKGVQNADAISQGQLIDKEISAMMEQLAADRAANNGALPYEAVKRLRTKVGDLLGDRELISTERRKMLGEFYEALSQDMRQAATDRGPDALKTFERANRYHRARVKRLEDFYTGLDKKVKAEDIWNLAMGDKPRSASQVSAVRKGLTPTEWEYTRRTLISRMGRPTASMATESGAGFSAQTFLTNYEHMKRNGTADAVFGRGQFRKDMDNVAKFASDIREGSQVLANPSGTAALGLGASILYGAMSMGIGAAVTGSSLGGLVGMAGGVGMNNAVARQLNNPKFVHWLAQSNKMPMREIPNHVTRLTKIAANDPELLEVLPEYLDRVNVLLDQYSQ